MNKLTTTNSSTLLQKKLGQLVTRLQQQANPQGTNQDFATLESVVSEAFKLLSQFYKDLSEPLYQPNTIIKDSIPKAADFNQNFTSIGDDLKTIFSEFGNMQGVVVGNFNYIVSRLNRLQSKLKNVSSLLGDYILFSNLPTKDAVFFSDSFNNTNRIEVGSPLLTVEQCEIDQDQGIATLPIDRQATSSITITNTPVINSNSNGVIGNNQQVGAQFHGTITDILDGNADTWFEYERVVPSDDGVALILDLTINLGDTKVINFIRINPNNFGARTPVEILSLDTSVDGHTLISVKDDIPIAGWIAQDEANTFTLAGSTSKYSGQGLFTFTPRKAKYIHISLRQDTPYIIQTATSNKYRYAIGIRDIEVSALSYKADGELISTNYSSADEIRKVVLLSSQNPDPATVSLLASIDHFISPDNGISWYQIRPKVSEGVANTTQAVPELINFNGSDINSVITSSPVYTLRYKAKMKRNKEAFTPDSSGIAEEVEKVGDLFSMPLSAPFSLTLQKPAVANTVKVIDPDIGTFGSSTKRKSIAIGNGNKLKVSIPFAAIPQHRYKTYVGGKWVLTKENNISVYVNGDGWSPGILSGSNKVYLLTQGNTTENATLEFGDGSTGAAVPDGAIVSYTIPNACVVNPSRGEGHMAKLEYPSSNDTSRDTLAIFGPDEVATEILVKGSQHNQLRPYIRHTSIVPDVTGNWKITFSDTTTFQTPVAFKDGSSELTGTGYYSIDFTNGVLHSYTPVSSVGDSTITYAYIPITVVPSSEWSYVDGGISISDDWFKTYKITSESVPSGVNYFNLSPLSIVGGTAVFIDSTTGLTPASMLTEVTYADGHSELLSVIQTSEQIESLTAGFNAIPFKMKISTDLSLQVRFSRSDIFQTKKLSQGAVSVDGDYYIDVTTGSSPTGQVYVYLGSAQSDPGSMTYYFDDPQGNAVNKYSINYNTGEVYTSAVTGANIAATYEYTNYLLVYTAAREIPSTDWEYDPGTNTVTLKDREILKNLHIPAIVGVGSVGSPKMYEIIYDHIVSTRQDIAELEPYFSPILRDYALQMITKGKLL